MIALAGPAGFYGTPATKLLMSLAIATYFLFAFPLQHYRQSLFHYNQHVLAKQQFTKMLLSKLVFLELPNLIFCSLLLYNFRIFERRFGSRKFVSHLLGTTLVACTVELLAFGVLNRMDVHLEDMPAGLYSMLFPLYVPFYCTIPRVAFMNVMGVPVTGKTIIYILGLQMAASSPESMLVMSCAVFSGILWRSNFLKVQTMLQVPAFVAKTFDCCLGRFLESVDTASSFLPMGATLEIQQRERMDRMEQQMMMAAIQASRRTEAGRPQPMNLAQGPGIFGNVNFNRGNGQQQHQNQNADESSSSSSQESAVSEDQVQRLLEMGFNDHQVRNALRETNNDARLATNLLLQNT